MSFVGGRESGAFAALDIGRLAESLQRQDANGAEFRRELKVAEEVQSRRVGACFLMLTTFWSGQRRQPQQLQEDCRDVQKVLERLCRCVLFLCVCLA